MTFVLRTFIHTVIGAALALSAGSCGRAHGTHSSAPSGTLAVQITDASYLVDDVRSVDVFVVRVDARLLGADSASAAGGAPDDSAGADGWVTIATPNRRVNLLDYQYHVALPLGGARIAAGAYQGFRLIIDPSRSGITRDGGMRLARLSAPKDSLPQLTRVGIGIFVRRPVIIIEGATTTLRIEFAVDEDFAQRGVAVAKKGLEVHPMLRGTVQIAGSTRAN